MENYIELPKETLISNDNVNHPPHYTKHPSGLECIEITRNMSFNLGNAIKYLWRYEGKNGAEDLKKSIWYLNDMLKNTYLIPIANMQNTSTGIIKSIAMAYPDNINATFMILLEPNLSIQKIVNAIYFIQEEIAIITGKNYEAEKI